MDAKETLKYLFENGHIPQTEHFKTIYAELDKPITEHPDVQRLIIQVDTLNQENKELKNKLTYIRKRYPEIDEMEQALKEPNNAG